MKLAGKRKITVGFVIQTFDDDNKCIAQEFVAGDQVDWEDENGEPIPSWDEYQPFDMVQPLSQAAIVAALEAEIATMKEEISRNDAEEYDRQQQGDGNG